MASATLPALTAVPRLRRGVHWIDEFLQSTAHSNSPEIFRKWAAISAIGAALQRKCFLLIQGEPLFANFFVALVGPPGIGKTRAIRFAKQLLGELGTTVKLSPNALTKEKLVDNLVESLRMGSSPAGEIFSQTAYACLLDELSTFVRHKDYEFMTQLTDLFDCPKIWESETISRGTKKIENLFLSILGGITPKSIQANWGEAAIGMGFTARLNLIYSEEAKAIDLFGVKEIPDLSPLLNDLRCIHDLHGRFSVTPEAGKFLQSWVSDGMPPMPADSRFAEYNPRRSIHWLKLCMVYSVADSDDLIINITHARRAKETLLEYESLLPLAFEHLGQNPMLAALNGLHSWMKIEYSVRREPIAEARIRRKLLMDVPPQYVDSAINELLASGLCSTKPSQTGRLFIPNLTRAALDD